MASSGAGQQDDNDEYAVVESCVGWTDDSKLLQQAKCLFHGRAHAIMPISPELAQPLMMMAGLGIICWLLMRGRVTRKRGQQGANRMLDLKHDPRAAGHSLPFTGTSSLGAPSDVLKWQVELHDLGRELKAELDCKLLAVQAMTEAYDQASERLVNLMRAAHQFGAAEPNPIQLVQQLAAQGVTPTQIAKSLGISEADVARLLGEPSVGQ